MGMLKLWLTLYYQTGWRSSGLNSVLKWLGTPLSQGPEGIENLRIARYLCRSCVPVIDGEVEAGSRAASRNEPVAVADLSFWGSAVERNVCSGRLCATDLLSPDAVTGRRLPTKLQNEGLCLNTASQHCRRRHMLCNCSTRSHAHKGSA